MRITLVKSGSTGTAATPLCCARFAAELTAVAWKRRGCRRWFAGAPVASLLAPKNRRSLVVGGAQNRGRSHETVSQPDLRYALDRPYYSERVAP